MKNIVFCCDNNYAQYVAVTIKSILCNNSPEDCHIYLFCNDLDESNRNRIDEIVQNTDAQLIIGTINDESLQLLKLRHWPINAWHRILLPQVLNDVDKILYLDADTIVMGSLDNLFKIDMSNHSVGGVIDIETFEDTPFKRCNYRKELKYVCSGVLLMNLAYWRKYNITDKIINWALENADILKCPDQDAINSICAEDKLVLPLKYGILSTFNFKKHIRFVKLHREECIDMIENPVIVHYAGMQPWYYEKKNHFFLKEWDKYNQQLEKPVKKRHCFHGKQLYMHYLRLWYKKIGIGSYNPQISASPETIEDIRKRFQNI